MNSLSWLIYAADIASGIGGTLTLLVLFGIAVAAGRMVVGLVMCNNSGDIQDLYAARSTTLKALAICLIASAIGSLIPSKETMYLIAASEIGEQVVTSDDAKRVMGKVETWLDNKLNDSRPQQQNSSN